MTNFDLMRERLEIRAGLVEPAKLDPRFSFSSLEKSEWSFEFEHLMRNRLIMGALRYGLIGDTANKPQYDRIASTVKRLKKYQETGNTEFLVDAANLCLLEFVEGIHPNKHFSGLDEVEGKHHVEVIQNANKKIKST